MDLFYPSNLKKEKLVELAQGTVLLLAFVLSAGWLVFLAFENKEAPAVKSLPMPQLDMNKIGKGLFAISPRTANPALEPLVQELVLVGKNTRPDHGTKVMISLGLKTSGSRKEVISGEKLFLTKQDSRYLFSDSETDLVIVPLALNGAEVLVQINEEEIILTPSPLFQKSLEDEAYVLSLKKAKMWAPDLFLNQWGGEEYRELGSKHKIEIDDKVYFLSVGDVLSWDGDHWSTPPEEGAPLVKLMSSSAHGLKIAVWDPSGYASSFIDIPLQQVSKAPLKIEDVITSVRPRSPTEITCQLGKRRVIVKEGDWWVKTERRWRPLRTAGDLEAFLHHDIQGELFIFEKVESAKGKVTLKGRCFDKMRTESQSLSLVVNTDKKPLSSLRKNESSHSSMIAKTKMAAPPIQHQHSDGEEKQ